MAEPTISIQVNTGSEVTPSWVNVATAIRWVGAGASAGSLSVPHPAPPLDATDSFFDDAAAPNDGTCWHDTGTDLQVTVAGRNTNDNVVRALETGASDATSDAPEFTAYDDATDAGNRTAPTVWILAGTSGSSNVSLVRAVNTTNVSPGGAWTGQTHAADPGTGLSDAPADLDGDTANSKVVCTTVLAASGNKTFNIAVAAPHDATAGLTTWVYALQYTYE